MCRVVLESWWQMDFWHGRERRRRGHDNIYVSVSRHSFLARKIINLDVSSWPLYVLSQLSLKYDISIIQRYFIKSCPVASLESINMSDCHHAISALLSYYIYEVYKDSPLCLVWLSHLMSDVTRTRTVDTIFCFLCDLWLHYLHFCNNVIKRGKLPFFLCFKMCAAPF